MTNNQIVINPYCIARFLGVMMILLLITSLGTNFVTYFTGHDYFYGLIPLFYVDSERNIPTGYSVLLLQFAAILLLILLLLKWKQPHSSSIYWVVLCLGFFYLAADEAWSFHEKIDEPGGILGNHQFHGLLNFAWIIPFIFLLPLLLLFFWKFLLSLSIKTRRLFLLGGILYVGGAIGVESIGGYLVDTIGRNNWWYYLEVTTEEGLEMTGNIVFIYALIDYLYDNYTEVSFMINKNSGGNLTE